MKTKKISKCFKNIYDFVLGCIHSLLGCMQPAIRGLDTPDKV